MPSECKARIGGLVFRFSGCLPEDREEEFIDHFLVTQGEPDVSVQISDVPDIVFPPEKQPDYSYVYLRSYCEAGKTHRFYRRDSGSYYAHLVYENDRPNEIELMTCQSKLRWTFQQILTCIGIEELLLQHSRAVLHASWIEKDGEAIVFSGPSGIGKSTQAALWEKYRGAQVRNGDRTLLWSRDGAEFACGLPYAGTSGICVNAAAPIRAIVVLGQGRENRIRRLPEMEAVKRLLSQLPVPKWNTPMIGLALEAASRAASAVPVYELTCLPDESAVLTLENALKEN